MKYQEIAMGHMMFTHSRALNWAAKVVSPICLVAVRIVTAHILMQIQHIKVKGKENNDSDPLTKLLISQKYFCTANSNMLLANTLASSETLVPSFGLI